MTTINQNSLDAVLRDFKNDAINQNDARAKIIDLTDADETNDLPEEGETEVTAQEVTNEVKSDDAQTQEALAEGETVKTSDAKEETEADAPTADDVASDVAQDQNDYEAQVAKDQEAQEKQDIKDSIAMSDGQAVPPSNKKRNRKAK